MKHKNFKSIIGIITVSFLLFIIVSISTNGIFQYKFLTNYSSGEQAQEKEESQEDISQDIELQTPANDGSVENVNEQEKILYYVEALHGGLLLTGAGNQFQYSTYYTLDRLFESLERYDHYKVVLEFEPSSLPHLNATYLEKLANYLQQGRIELTLTGTYQEFLGNLSYDLALYSLRNSIRLMQDYLNYTPTVFATQEMSLRPDLPKLLNEVGIKYVLGRVWMSYWGNLEFWSDINNQDLLLWKYENYSVTLIPDYTVWSWNFTEEYVEEFIENAHESGIKHPLQVRFDDLEIWKKYENIKTNRTFPFFHKDNDLVQFVTLTEYIETIADEPKDIVEIPSSAFKLRLPDKHNYTNWEGVELNSTQFKIIVNKTQELAKIWLSLYTENQTSPLVNNLFQYVGRLYFHDIWVVYNYAFGACIDEGFESWFVYWTHYYQIALDFLDFNNITISETFPNSNNATLSEAFQDFNNATIP